MGHGTYGAGEGTLQKGANMVLEAEQDFVTIANRLTGQINDLKGKWGGEGAIAFNQLHAAWDEKNRTIVGALNAFAESLGITDTINVNNDQEQADKIRLNTSRLEG